MLSSLHVKYRKKQIFNRKILKWFPFRKSSQTEWSKIDFHRGQRRSEEFEESVREPWHDIAAATTGLIMTCWTSKRDRLENSAVSSGEETKQEREKPDKKEGKKQRTRGLRQRILSGTTVKLEPSTVISRSCAGRNEGRLTVSIYLSLSYTLVLLNKLARTHGSFFFSGSKKSTALLNNVKFYSIASNYF